MHGQCAIQAPPTFNVCMFTISQPWLQTQYFFVYMIQLFIVGFMFRLFSNAYFSLFVIKSKISVKGLVFADSNFSKQHIWSPFRDLNFSLNLYFLMLESVTIAMRNQDEKSRMEGYQIKICTLIRLWQFWSYLLLILLFSLWTLWQLSEE